MERFEDSGQENDDPNVEEDTKLHPPPSSLPETQTSGTLKTISTKLNDRRVLITGTDSDIGRSIVLSFAKEGADIALVYTTSKQRTVAKATKRLVEAESKKCVLISSDLRTEESCKKVIEETVSNLGGIDVLVVNTEDQTTVNSIEDISEDQVEKTFRTNVFSSIFLTKHALSHLKSGSSIVFSTLDMAHMSTPHLVDYVSTKTALIGLIRSLSKQLEPRGIRVNGVAPGPVWTREISKKKSKE